MFQWPDIAATSIVRLALKIRGILPKIEYIILIPSCIYLTTSAVVLVLHSQSEGMNANVAVSEYRRDKHREF